MPNREQRRAERKNSESKVVALYPQHRHGTFVVPLIGARCSEDLGQGIPFGNCLVTNNRKVLCELVDPYLQAMIGALEADAIRNAHLAMYVRIDDSRRTKPSGNENVSELLTYLRTARRFVDSLWYIRDSAARFDLGFLNIQGVTSSNSFASGDYCRADGSRDVVAFSTEEIVHADTIRADAGTPTPITGAHVDTSRVMRADYFLQAARAAPDVGVKVAFYCTCLEALLAPKDVTELTYRLAERAAILGSDQAGERRQIFGQVRDGYASRSRVIHGDVLSEKKLRDLPRVATELDNILRRILNRLFNDRTLMDVIEGKDVDDYFARVIFGSDAPAGEAS